MKDFNLAKYLKEHNLGSHGILGRYVDLQALKEEDDYGNNKPVSKVPYVGADEKLDGFGDEFDQVEPVSEADGEGSLFSITLDTASNLNKIKMYAKSKGISVKVINPEGPGGGWPEVEYTGSKEALEGLIDTFFPQDAEYTKSQIMPVDQNLWMAEVDGSESYKEGNWTCNYDNFQGVLIWSYGNVPLDKLAVYATPNWDNDGTTPIQIDVDERTEDNMTLKQSKFEDFNEYATAMKPYLDRIEDLESDWGSLAPSDDLAELEKPENIYSDDEESEFGSNEDMMMSVGGDQIEQGIISLLDHGFETEDILDACKMFIDAHVNAAMQGKKF